MTPLRMRYEEAYIKAHPFNKLINGMMSSHMIEDTVEIMLAAIDQGVHINVVINNRAAGNAPSIAEKISERFLKLIPKGNS
jgi:phosphoheptose isomerase